MVGQKIHENLCRSNRWDWNCDSWPGLNVKGNLDFEFIKIIIIIVIIIIIIIIIINELSVTHS